MGILRSLGALARALGPVLSATGEWGCVLQPTHNGTVGACSPAEAEGNGEVEPQRHVPALTLISVKSEKGWSRFDHGDKQLPCGAPAGSEFLEGKGQTSDYGKAEIAEQLQGTAHVVPFPPTPSIRFMHISLEQISSNSMRHSRAADRYDQGQLRRMC